MTAIVLRCVLYGSVVPGWSAAVTLVFCWYFRVFRWCSGVFRCSSGVLCSLVRYSGVPGFIVCHSSFPYVLLRFCHVEKSYYNSSKFWGSYYQVPYITICWTKMSTVAYKCESLNIKMSTVEYINVNPWIQMWIVKD